ncbi:probable LRR receptor-like serine/threonine-protein kinase At3g47570 [Actinidia eriantha]|uniref:probable LRR receptor-like serine/threonine-protein kinase At3g47570 n=1 Tax=Actinidia eriantha TaxID=165200 RepID=UPI00258AB01F|nr:probable LRR receptor-like serine/threonine-protein kinase At3g47570 [Actinidia eriantha]
MLDISKNNLSGEISGTIGDCVSLEYLHTQGNSFGFFKSIQYLDLSQNNFMGHIPNDLGNLSFLQNLNLYFNDLEVEVPTTGVFTNASTISCPTKVKKEGKSLAFKVVVAVVGTIMFLIAITSFSVLCWKRRTRKVTSLTPLEAERLLRICYHELMKATAGFSSENLIGSGTFGSAYKGKLNYQGERLIAVKVLNLQNSRASTCSMAECKTLKNIRHRNLIKLLTYCPSIDSKGDEFKALVYEYMTVGSLNTLLHPAEANSSTTLNLLQRLNIVIDVVTALDYLRNDCEPLIAHCDLKPSNILPDNDTSAHVSDFGLARLVSETTSNISERQTSSIGIKGSVGYAAPEHGTGSEAQYMGMGSSCWR